LRRLVVVCVALLAWVPCPAGAQEAGAGTASAATDAAKPGSGEGRRRIRRDVPVVIENADVAEYERRRELYTVRGRPVVIRQGDNRVSADFITFSDRTGRGVASGDVVYSDGVDTVRTAFIEFQVDTLQGVLFDAEFDVPSNRVRMRGAEVARTGDKTWTFEEGEFTTCRCPDPDARKPWQVKAEEAELEIEGYGTVRNATVEILGVPLLWLPWMIYPLKTERQSGLLFPEVSLSGRNGMELGLPVFWAVGDPLNLILTPRWMSKRGVKGDVGYEYVLGEHSGGAGLGSYLYDQEVDPDTRETPFGRHRWATRGNHDFFLPGDWRLKTSYAFASDNAHPTDFDDLGAYRAERFLPALAFAGRSFGALGLLGVGAGAQFADDLQNPDDSDRDEFLLQRLPELSLDLLPASLPFASWLAPSLGLRYAWYQQAGRPQDEYADDLLVAANGRFFDSGIDGLPSSQEQGRTLADSVLPDPNADDFPDDPADPARSEGDGVFQEGELLADDGHRALLTPRLGLPLRLLDFLELYPEAGWHETLYSSAADGFERRGLFTGRLDLRTRLRGVLGPVTHLLEPRLGYAYVSDVGQGDHPLYVPATAVPQERVRELHLDNVTRDVADRIEEWNGLTFAVGNRFHGRAGDAGAAKLLADFALSALYDFDEGEFGNLYLDGTGYPVDSMRVRFNLGFDPRAASVSEGFLALFWADERGDRVDVSYRFLRDIPRFFEAFPQENERFEEFREGVDRIHQVNAGFRIALTENWGLTYRGAYSFERTLFLGNEGGIEYISRCRCWAVRLVVRDSRSRGATVAVEYRILGLGDDSRTPFESAGTRRFFGLLDAY
jgi:lipopolysaccharide assembly outer membrane protein LptD (OstA)